MELNSLIVIRVDLSVKKVIVQTKPVNSYIIIVFNESNIDIATYHSPAEYE